MLLHFCLFFIYLFILFLYYYSDVRLLLNLLSRHICGREKTDFHIMINAMM